MRITLICCPFQTSFGAYGSSLRSAIEAATGSAVQWVASNCGCGDPMEANRRFQAKDCDYFDMPLPSGFRSNSNWKTHLRGKTRSLILYWRARKYSSMLDRPEVVHFQQVLNAYGSKAVFSWLKQPSSALRVVTVHELDDDQRGCVEANRTYNCADAIIVHCAEMKDCLVRLNVQQEKIHVVLHGTSIPPRLATDSREGILFYAGHKVLSGKGVETAFKAISIVRQQRPGSVPVLKVHGHYGSCAPPEALDLAKRLGVSDNIMWLNQVPEDQLIRLYQQSLMCVLPYTGSFAGLAASTAAACSLPVVCTRKAGLPDHLGEAGIWIDESKPEQLAARIIELLDSDSLRREAGERLRERAEKSLSWSVIAEQTLSIYQEAIKLKGTAPRASTAVAETRAGVA